MIGKIIGAVAGSKVADKMSGISSPVGAAAGMLTATALRRMSLPAMIVLGAGGYFAKKFYDRKQAEKASLPAPTWKAPKPTATPV